MRGRRVRVQSEEDEGRAEVVCLILRETGGLECEEELRLRDNLCIAISIDSIVFVSIGHSRASVMFSPGYTRNEPLVN